MIRFLSNDFQGLILNKVSTSSTALCAVNWLGKISESSMLGAPRRTRTCNQ